MVAINPVTNVPQVIGAVVAGIILKMMSSPPVDNTNPPEAPPTLPKFGPYCLKASCHLKDGDNKTLSKFEGYGTENNIGDKTFNYCSKVARDNYCTDPMLTMLPKNSFTTCEGQIVHTNNITGTISVSFPN